MFDARGYLSDIGRMHENLLKRVLECRGWNGVLFPLQMREGHLVLQHDTLGTIIVKQLTLQKL